MKLAWSVITHPDKLWVQLMRAKYGCGNHTLPQCVMRSKSSHIWRAIHQVWPCVMQQMSWVIRNGHSARFWKDLWVPGVDCLENLVQERIEQGEENFTVASYADSNGWAWSKLRRLLPSVICSKINLVKLPSPGMEDFLCWNLTSDGKFSLNSSYELLQDCSQHVDDRDPFFVKVWAWQGPQRIRVFLWKLAHGRLLSNEERRKRGMCHNATCPRCLTSEETIMHVMRDCE